MLGLLLVAAASAGTFGKVVVIGGHAADLALDEGRGRLYIANFGANRIEIMSLASRSLEPASMNVAPQPASLALSPDGRYLVVTHYGNFQAPGSSSNALTVIDLETNDRKTFAMGNPPLGVAFGIDGLALIVTTNEFVLFDPLLGTTQVLATVEGVTANTLPVPPPKFPPQIVAASVAASADHTMVFGLTDTIRFRYDVRMKQVISLGYTATPPLGPRVVSVSRDGQLYAAGWAVFRPVGASDVLMAQFRDASGSLNTGGHAIDSERSIFYGQVPRAAPVVPSDSSSSGTPVVSTTPDPPELLVADLDNLTVRERLRLPENLAGKSVLSADGSTMYAASDSGVLVLPVGSLDQYRRVRAQHEDLLFQSNACDRRAQTQELVISDPGGGATPFAITSSSPGVSVSPSSGVTPMTVRVRVDAGSFQGQRGTITATLTISSPGAVNIPETVRVLVNLRDPDQRGTVINVPGKLVDVVTDPDRDRFFVLRQDKNQVLVYDGTNYSLLHTLRTGNTPTQMAVSFDRRYLIVGNDNSQIANVFDLETLEPQQPIVFPAGHYPRSIAASGNAILAASRVAGPIHTIDRVDLGTRRAVELPSLGIYKNDVDADTVLTASPNGSAILVAQANGTIMLYNANVDSFIASRKDETSLSGGYAASSYDVFAAGHQMLNASLYPTQKFSSATGLSSGYVFVDRGGFRTTAANSASPGVIERLDVGGPIAMRATRIAEAPVLKDVVSAFTRTVAPLYSRKAIINLTTSGFTVLAWDYDASLAPPRIDSIVNAADLRQPVAPGGLITLFGNNLSAINAATKEMPLPTALGETCLTANGVPMPMLFVSPGQINAQLPFQVDGNATLILRTPGGVSDNFNLTISPAAPSIFHSGTAGPNSNLPTIYRSNNSLVTISNPIHRGETITIYLTGLGKTWPAVETGMPAPADPPAASLVAPTVTLGGVSLDVKFAGLAPGQVGVYQIEAGVPITISTGLSIPLLISQGGSTTSVEVRVVE